MSNSLLSNSNKNRLQANRVSAINAKINNLLLNNGTEERINNFFNSLYNKESLASFVIVDKNDNIIFQRDFIEDGLDNINYSRSLAKTVAGLLFGVAVKQNIINMSDNVLKYLPYEAKGTVVENATFDDLMGMRSGLLKDTALANYLDPPFNTQSLEILSTAFGVVNPVLVNLWKDIYNYILKDGPGGKSIYAAFTTSQNITSNSGKDMIKEYKSQDKLPEDRIIDYCSHSIIIATIGLQTAIGDFFGYKRDDDGFTTLPIEEFVKWANENLIHHITNKEYKVTFFVDSQNKIWNSSSGIYAPLRFYLDIAILIRNNGRINGKQIIDEEFMNEINDFDGYNDFPNRWYQRNTTNNYYYYRGIHAYYLQRPQRPFFNKILWLSGFSGHRILITDNYIVAVFGVFGPNERRITIQPEIFSGNISITQFTDALSFIDNFNTLFTLNDGTILSSKKDWDNYYYENFNDLEYYAPICYPPRVDSKLYGPLQFLINILEYGFEIRLNTYTEEPKTEVN